MRNSKSPLGTFTELAYWMPLAWVCGSATEGARCALGSSESLRDRWQRQLKYLRISVTDRCNYTCHYCMPAGGWETTERRDLLTLEEIARLVRIAARWGVRKVRLTGEEPLLRKNMCQLIEWIAATPDIEIA